MICSSTRTIVTPRELQTPRLPINRFSSPFYVNGNLNGPSIVVTNCSSSSLTMEGKPTAASPPSLILTSGASGRVRALFSMRELKRLAMLIHALILFLLLPLSVVRKRTAAALSWAASTGNKQERKVRAPPRIVTRRNICVGVSSSSPPPASSRVTVDQEVAARRALAVRRVLEDDGGDGRTVREFSLFRTKRGDTLFTQSWTSVSIRNRALVVLLHGLNEHSGRYSDFAKQLNAHGFEVYGMDWIGHGGSDGLHAYVHSLDEAVSDMKLFLEKVLADNPGLPCFCLGHSTGAAIILKAVLDPKIESRVSGIVLTSPAVGVQPSHQIFTVLAPIVSFLMPRCQFSAANKKGTQVSRDPEALVAKYSDPLVFTGSIRVRTGYEILRISSYLQQNLNKVKVPFLVLHGKADSVTDPEASEKLYEEASSTDKRIILFEGLLHDLLFEPERQAIVEVIIDWLRQRV